MSGPCEREEEIRSNNIMPLSRVSSHSASAKSPSLPTFSEKGSQRKCWLYQAAPNVGLKSSFFLFFAILVNVRKVEFQGRIPFYSV